MLQLWSVFETYLKGEDGATMVEYGFMLVLIALAVVVAATALGAKVLSFLELVTI